MRNSAISCLEIHGSEQPAARADTDIDGNRSRSIIAANRGITTRADTATSTDTRRATTSDDMTPNRQVVDLKFSHRQCAADRQATGYISIIIDGQDITYRHRALQSTIANYGEVFTEIQRRDGAVAIDIELTERRVARLKLSEARIACRKLAIQIELASDINIASHDDFVGELRRRADRQLSVRSTGRIAINAELVERLRAERDALLCLGVDSVSVVLHQKCQSDGISDQYQCDDRQSDECRFVARSIRIALFWIERTSKNFGIACRMINARRRLGGLVTTLNGQRFRLRCVSRIVVLPLTHDYLSDYTVVSGLPQARCQPCKNHKHN